MTSRTDPAPQDTYECEQCGSRLARGNNSPAQTEAQMRRHERTFKHMVGMQHAEMVNRAWRKKKAAPRA